MPVEPVLRHLQPSDAGPLPEPGQIPDRKLPETDLPGTDLSETDPSETELPETGPPGTDLSETELPETELPGMDLPETEFPGAEPSETEVPDHPLQSGADPQVIQETDTLIEAVMTTELQKEITTETGLPGNLKPQTDTCVMFLTNIFTNTAQRRNKKESHTNVRDSFLYL